MRSSSRTAALVAVACLLVAGCTDSDDTPPTPAAGDPPTASTSTEAPPTTPDPSPRPTATAPASPTPPAADAPLALRLLSGAEVPGLNAGWRWRDGETVEADPDPIGYCDKVDVFSIGATAALHRVFDPPGDGKELAGELVAEFPDAATAARAGAVLRSWHKTCARRLSPDLQAKVGPLQPVTLASGAGAWYLVTVPPTDEAGMVGANDGEEGEFAAFGFVVAGTRIALLTMDSYGLDYNYPRGREPMAAMVAAAAAKLG